MNRIDKCGRIGERISKMKIADDKKWNDIIWIKFCMDRMKLIPKEEWDERTTNYT
jgi:hypothetical protein